MIRRAAALAVIAAMVAGVATTAWAVLGLMDGRSDTLSSPDTGVAASASVVGAYLLWRAVADRMAVMLCVSGVVSTAVVTLGAVADGLGERGPLHGAGSWVAWGAGMWVISAAMIVPIALLFPTGRLSSRRFRVVLWFDGVAAVVILAINVFYPGDLFDTLPAGWSRNPVQVVPAALVPSMQAVGAGAFFGFGVLLIVAVVSLFLRRRRATGTERQQLMVLIYGALVTAVFVLAANVGLLPDTAGTELLSVAGGATIPVAIAVAVLRYRLYDIDRVVSRTVTYVLVLAVLAGVYAGLVLGLSALVPSGLGQLGILVATLTVTVLAVPLTRRVRRVVDRRFNRSRFDAERVVASFAAGLRERPADTDVPAELVTAVRRAVQPEHATVWLVSS